MTWEPWMTRTLVLAGVVVVAFGWMVYVVHQHDQQLKQIERERWMRKWGPRR